MKLPSPPHTFTADSFRRRPKTTDELNVWGTAAQLTRGYLEHYGNRLSPAHWHAIQSLADVFTAVTFGAVTGRFGVGMPTGAGKTMSAVGFIVALHRHQRPESVVVCCEKVTQLVNFKRELLKWGVPESEIGLWYAEDYVFPKGFQPEPRTLEPETRRYLLLTHSRTRKQKQLQKMNTFEDRPRSLWIFDESLLATAHLSFDYLPLKGAVAWLEVAAQQYKIRSRYPRQDRERKQRLTQLASYLKDECLPTLDAELAVQEAEDRAPTIVTLPHRPEPEIETWRQDLRPLYGRSRTGRDLIQLIHKVLRMHNQEIRLVKLEESVLVTFVVTIPPELQRMVVLDASFSIRMLENMDKGLTHVADFEDIKDWSNVTFNFDKGPSGRQPISSHFTEAAQWALKKISQYPETDPILLLTFKDKPDSEDLEEGERRQYRKAETRMVEKFTQALVEAKVPHLRIKRIVDGQEKEQDRIQFLTFGNETSLSDYKHIPHVVFLGVLHRSDTDLVGAFLSAEGDLEYLLQAEDVPEAKLSEQAHGVYQGASRGTCRTMVDGKALAQTVDLRHFDPWALVDRIRPVTKNATFNLPPASELHHVEQSAVQVLEALATYVGRSISIRALKTLANLTHLSKWQFASVVARALLMQESSRLPVHLKQAARWSRVEGSRSLVKQ